MPAYLITGRGGSGKSTVFLELKRRGIAAFDGDAVPNLARWEDIATGQPVTVNNAGDIDFSKVGWVWDTGHLLDLLQTHDELFLCGSASNQLDHHDKFDKVFVLTLDEDTHDYRLRTRKSDYGKHPNTRKHIIRSHQRFVQHSLQRGAIPIDATQPIEKMVDSILSHL